MVYGAGLTQYKAVVIARRTSQRAELDGEVVSSRFLAAVTVATRRVPVAAALCALRSRWRRLANHNTTSSSRNRRISVELLSIY